MLHRDYVLELGFQTRVCDRALLFLKQFKQEVAWRKGKNLRAILWMPETSRKAAVLFDERVGQKVETGTYGVNGWVHEYMSGISVTRRGPAWAHSGHLAIVHRPSRGCDEGRCGSRAWM